MSEYKRPGPDRVLTVEAVKVALENAGGLKTAASLLLGVHRSTLYRFMDEYPEIKEASRDIDEQTKDMAEGQVLKAIKNGDMNTVRWFLDRKARERGYGHMTIDVGNKNGEPFKVEGETTIDVSKLSLEEQKTMLDLHRKASAAEA